MRKNVFLRCIVILLFVILFTTSFVSATEDNTNDNANLQIGNSDIYFSLKNDYYDLVSGIQNDDEQFATYLTQKENYLAYFEANNIIYDAVNSLDAESLSQEIVITQSTNSTIQQVYNLKMLSSESLDEFSSTFISTLKENVSCSFEDTTFLSEGTYTSASGDIYLYLVFSATVNESPMQLAYYCSIVNGRANLFTLQYLSSVSDEEMHSVINAFSYQERDTTLSFMVGLVFFLIFIGILVFFFFMMRKKKDKDVPVEYNEKYNRFGGFLLLYFVLLILNAVLILFDFITVIAISSVSTIFLVTFVLQDAMTLGILIYNAILLWKKKEETPKKVIRNLSLLAIVTIVLCLLRIVYSFFDSSYVYSTAYYAQEMILIIRNVLYATIWICYFRKSVRVKSYYREVKK